MDLVDRTLINALRRDARIPTAELARIAGVSRQTAHDRLKKLQSDGIIRGSQVTLSPEALGHPLRAMLMVHLAPDASNDQREVAKQIATIPDVDRVHIVTGRYDFIVEVLAKDMDEVGRIILERIRRIEGVGNTETLLCFWSLDGPGVTVA